MTCLLEEVPLPAPSAVLALGDPLFAWWDTAGDTHFLYDQELCQRKFFPFCRTKNQFKDFNEYCKGESRER